MRISLIAERAVGSKSTIVPNYVTESGYTEDIPGRGNVGDTQDRRLLAVLNLTTGKSSWADASFVPADDKPAADRHRRPRPKLGRRGARRATCAGRCRRSRTTAS